MTKHSFDQLVDRALAAAFDRGRWADENGEEYGAACGRAAVAKAELLDALKRAGIPLKAAA